MLKKGGHMIMLGIGTGSWLPPASAYIRKNSVIKPSGFTSK